ncbi:MAG: DMT family transporter [Tildeniella nuda ZEHNDER 1965/U140]|jgi:drug/metabolite transporter (DMT)-like permease|nr:DMT family transporter [Tildeniella nuda ZEHNDER 1965/U140]
MTQPKLNSQGLIAALCATATWGMVGVFVRWLPGWSPFAVLAGRFLVATATMLPILFVASSVRHDLTRSLRTPLIWGLSLPAIGSYVLGTTAFQMAPVGEVTLLFTTSPLFIIAYKYLVHLPIKRTEGLGMLLATAGVCLIMVPQLSTDQTVSWQTIAGYLLALSAAGLLSLYVFWLNVLTQQKIAPKSIEVVFLTCLLGSILSLLCEIFFSKLSIGSSIDERAILVLLGLGILSTVLPFWCYTVAVQRLPIVLATAILLLEPMFAVLFASIALQEIPSLWFGMGSVLILWGLLLIAREASAA